MSLFSLNRLAITALCVCAAQSATALPIDGLWNTGVDSSGTAQGVGFNEIHYSGTLPDGANPAYQFRTVAKPGTYVSNPSDAAWIGPSLTPLEGALVDDPIGTYVYKLLFSLDGFDPSSAEITGSWASDNWSSIWLNGENTGLSLGMEGFRSLSAFRLFDGMLDVGGFPINFDTALNTVEFRVLNAPGHGNPSALLVSGIQGSAAASSSGDRTRAVPDGGSMVLMMGGAFAALVTLVRALRV